MPKLLVDFGYFLISNLLDLLGVLLYKSIVVYAVGEFFNLLLDSIIKVYIVLLVDCGAIYS